MAEPGDQTRARSQLPGLLIPGLVPPLLGVLAFALLRESYAWFYGRYGVIPEDVGVSQIRMLTGVHTCGIDACLGVVWRVNESDAAIRVEVDPPDAHAPRISDPHPS